MTCNLNLSIKNILHVRESVTRGLRQMLRKYFSICLLFVAALQKILFSGGSAVVLR